MSVELQTASLPIYQIRDDIVASLKECPRLIIQAPTGSGKSTQVPQMLLDSGLAGVGKILVLQPRRLAARLLAARVAEERGGRLGEEIGFQIRMEKVANASTRILFITEGVLPRMMMGDAMLQDVSAIVFDEFHERHLDGDIALALMGKLQEKRPDLKLVVMSATLDAAFLQERLKPCRLLKSEGRTFPVDIRYLAKEPDFERQPVWQLAADALDEAFNQGQQGDALIFMPGAYEISRTIEVLSHKFSSRDHLILPLHGELPLEQQQQAVAHADVRKIIVSTNVAETSLTIDGVRIVVDSGLARIARYDSNRGINTLLVEKISQASADQRAGRAGRTAEGTCIRLWSKNSIRKPQELPEVKRLDLSETVLLLKSLGFCDLREFPWVENPSEVALERAGELLTLLGALDFEGGLTEIGRKMTAFPVHPRMSRLLLAADEWGCLEDACLVAALFHERSLWIRDAAEAVERKQDEEKSDFFALMRAWRKGRETKFSVDACNRMGIHARTARQVERLYEQFLRIAVSLKLDVEFSENSSDALRKCLLISFLDHLAMRCDGGTLRCFMLHQKVAWVSRHSAIQHAPLLVAAEARETQVRGQLQTLLSMNTAVEEQWLQELFPHAFSDVEELVFDAVSRKVLQRRQRRFFDLVLLQKEQDAPVNEAAAQLLASEVVRNQYPLQSWDDAVDQWIVRLNCLTQWMPELELPHIGEEEKVFVVAQLCQGCVSYKQVKDKQVRPILESWLSALQKQALEQFVPERIALPSGRNAKLRYTEGQNPTLSARIQDLYDLRLPLAVAGGKVELKFEILAPNFRPVQITDNLERFWRETYPQLKNELQRRYPKHEWR